MSTDTSASQDTTFATARAKGSNPWKPFLRVGKEALVLVIIGIVFVVPFIFIVLTAAKTRQEAALLRFSVPSV